MNRSCKKICGWSKPKENARLGRDRAGERQVGAMLLDEAVDAIAILPLTFRPIFLRRVPERKPRTEWACQSVAFMRSFRVTPPDRCNRCRTLAVLLAGRGLPGGVPALARLLALVALRRALVARVLVRGFGFWAVPVGCGVACCSGLDVLMS